MPLTIWRVEGTQRPSRASTPRCDLTLFVRWPRCFVLAGGRKSRARKRNMEALLGEAGEDSGLGYGCQGTGESPWSTSATWLDGTRASARSESRSRQCLCPHVSQREAEPDTKFEKH